MKSKNKSKALLLALLLLASAVACGRKGDLIIPGTVLPAAVNDLKAEPRDKAVILSWTMPDKNTSGRPLTDLTGFVIARAELPEGQEGCPCQLADVGAVDLEFPKDALIKGKKVVWADRDPALEYGKRYLYKVYGRNKDEYKGPESNPAAALLLVPPAVPENLTARPGNRSVALSWARVEKDVSGRGLTGLAGYNLYRYTKKGELPAPPLNAAPVQADTYTDPGLVNGTTYFYQLSALRGAEPPYTEGEMTQPVSATPSDIEPPAPPQGFQATPAEGAILLSWDLSPEPDVTGYKIYRRAEGETAFTALTPGPVNRITYKDTDTRPGVSYTYAVTAVDNAVPPNESAFSEKVTVQASAASAP